MISKTVSWIAAALLCLALWACSDNQAKICDDITKAIEQQDVSRATTLADGLYTRLDECSIKTLASLTADFTALVAVNAANGDEAAAIQAMRNTVACYDKAMEKDPTQAMAMWKDIEKQTANQGVAINLTVVAEAFRTQLEAYDNPTSELKEEAAQQVVVDSIDAQAATEGMAAN
ncbi:MAG: hypothetical protein LIO90_10765 [Bacteroidales bacterium]|nr:hypothetical protein [Bacteroidales bacterium]